MTDDTEKAALVAQLSCFRVIPCASTVPANLSIDVDVRSGGIPKIFTARCAGGCGLSATNEGDVLMSDSYNRLLGASATTVGKMPVRAATIGNITLSGYQTIDGQAFDAAAEAAYRNMRVLVWQQTDSKQNGIYLANSGTWTRTPDFDGNTDFVQGSTVYVTAGTVSAGLLFGVTSADPQSVGVNNITFGPIMSLDVCDIRWFGAVAGGSVDCSSAITSAAAYGAVHIPRGNYAVNSSISVTTPVSFADGAYITVASGKSVSIAGPVTAPQQWIFRGSGTVTLDIDGTGLNDYARYAHVSWFGAAPSSSVDQSTYINAAYTAFGNSREGVLEFGRGVYRIDSPITANRGMYSFGAGSRITVFTLTNFSGTDAFVTNGDACVFEKIQFDTSGNTPSRSCIHLAHNDCTVRDVMLGQVFCGVLDEGRGNRIERIYQNSGSAAGAGSSVVKLGGNRALVRDIRSMGTPAPESVVLVSSTTAGISDLQIENIEASSDAIGVYVNSGNQTISRSSIRGVRARGSGASGVTSATRPAARLRRLMSRMSR